MSLYSLLPYLITKYLQCQCLPAFWLGQWDVSMFPPVPARSVSQLHNLPSLQVSTTKYGVYLLVLRIVSTLARGPVRLCSY